jgi:hypothetical protein
MSSKRIKIRMESDQPDIISGGNHKIDKADINKDYLVVYSWLNLADL